MRLQRHGNCGGRHEGRHFGGFGRRHGRGGGHFGGDDGRQGWGFDGGRGGRHRMFDGDELRLVLLRLIADKARHGYDLIRAIEERTGGVYAPSPGIVYPSLTMLSDMGYIGEQAGDGARKLFAITPEGTAHLTGRDADIAAILARLDALAAMRERTDVMPIRRAMHNLRSVLQHRLGEGLGKERLHDAVALIDEAARKIEKL